MYAVIETGGKQYRVELGSELAVERLDAAPGETINFDRVLLVADGDAAQIGTPVVADALVTGEVLRQDRGDKIIVFKYRPKARHRAKKGHRQEQTVIRVADIRFGGRSAADEAGEQDKAQAKGRKAAAAEAEKKAAADQALAAKLAADEAAQAEAAKPKAEPKTTAAKKTTTKAADKTATKTTTPATDKPAAKSAAAKPKAAPKTAAKPKTTKPATRQDHCEEGRVTEMAHKKAGSSSKNGRDSAGQRLGVKAGDGQLVTAGSIIVRQRGMTFLAGPGTGLGKDYTLFATMDGHVKFEHARKDKKRVRIVAPSEMAAAQTVAAAGGKA